MPVTKSAAKALRRDQRRQKVNLRTRRKVKEAIKNCRQKTTKKSLAEAYRQLDQAAKKGVFHQKKSSRLKSKLAKLLKPTRKKSAKKKKS
jgi:small subunit ribosomal protein S20